MFPPAVPTPFIIMLVLSGWMLNHHVFPSRKLPPELIDGIRPGTSNSLIGGGAEIRNPELSVSHSSIYNHDISC